MCIGHDHYGRCRQVGEDVYVHALPRDDAAHNEQQRTEKNRQPVLERETDKTIDDFHSCSSLMMVTALGIQSTGSLRHFEQHRAA